MVIHDSVDATYRRKLDDLVNAYLRAETRADVDTILSLVTDDIEYEQFGAADKPARGLEAVRARYQHEFANAVHERDASVRRRYGDSLVVDERTWEGRVIGRLGPFVGGGKRISHRALYIFELRGDQIARLIVHRDLAAIMQQLS